MGSVWGKVVAKLFSRREMRCIILGLDAAGKTSILYRLKLGKAIVTIPTIAHNVETVRVGNTHITAWDIGGGYFHRKLWRRNYFENSHGIIYVVDANDRERLEETTEELFSFIDEEEFRDVSILILANKSDLPNAMRVGEVADRMNLYSVRSRRWHIAAVSATTGDGLLGAMEWLANSIERALNQ
mmetsp:Transcript_1955/g.4349  ORF Transcript_1955/g.4349 Transcript_1955/m.4349 type:complete len:185 (+) Transcript_1955:38-592(+)